MGVDAMIYLDGTQISDDQIVAANKEHGALFERYEDYDGKSYVTVDTGWSRYFSRGYPRGDWTHLRRLIGTARRAFPGVPVVYASDSSWYGETPPITESELASLDLAWGEWCNSGFTSHLDPRWPG